MLDLTFIRFSRLFKFSLILYSFFLFIANSVTLHTCDMLQMYIIAAITKIPLRIGRSGAPVGEHHQINE